MKTNAFTLLEIIIAMLILSIVTAGVYGLFITNYKLLTMAKHNLQAVNQAAKVMEKMRMYVSANDNYPEHAREALALGTHDGAYINTNLDLPVVPVIDGVRGQQWDYTVSETRDDRDNLTDLRRATVSVRWDEL